MALTLSKVEHSSCQTTSISRFLRVAQVKKHQICKKFRFKFDKNMLVSEHLGNTIESGRLWKVSDKRSESFENLVEGDIGNIIFIRNGTFSEFKHRT